MFRTSLIYISLFRILKLTMLSLTAAVGIHFIDLYLGPGQTQATLNSVATVAFIGASLILFSQGAAVYKAAALLIDGERLIFQQGIIATESSSAWIAELIGIDIKQSFWGRVFNYGTLEIETRGNDKIIFANMAQPAYAEALITDRKAKLKAMNRPDELD